MFKIVIMVISSQVNLSGCICPLSSYDCNTYSSHVVTEAHILNILNKNKNMFQNFTLLREIYSLTKEMSILRSVPSLNGFHSFDFLLELKNSVHKRFGRGRAARNVNIDRHNTIATANHGVRVMIISTAVGARSHRQHPSRFGHLIVDTAESRSHFIRQSSGDNDDIGLSG